MKQVFDVQGMSCSHCVASVTQAVKTVDPAADIVIDLSSGRVEVDSDQDRRKLAAAIAAEGYTVSP